MNKTFMRSTDSEGLVLCSWYDQNGRRCRMEVSNVATEGKSIRETDDIYGFMPYAQQQGYTIIDDAPLPHPGRITE